MLRSSLRSRGSTGRLLSTIDAGAKKMSSEGNRTKIPDRAEVVIVGGGVIGTSVAYHLAALDVDVMLLERDTLTSGTTWHAAGLMVTFGSTSETATNIRKYSKDLYSKLEEETGQSTGIHKCGFIEVAANKDRLEEYRRVAAFNRYCGIDVHEISPGEVRDLFPLARIDDIEAGFYVPDDGRVNPVDVTVALAKGARMRGAKIVEGVTVSGVSKENGRVTGVVLEDDRVVRADKVVNCGGMWAREFASRSGVLVPNQAAEHYYMLTDAMPDVDPGWPVLEDPASYAYIRPEGGGLMVGLFEPKAAAWHGHPQSFTEIPPDWDRMAPYLDHAMSRVPATLDAGIKTFFCGPESFTPDLSPVVGEAPELRNYFVCAGMNSIGILSGGGMGRVVAHWIVNGRPDVDVTGFNIDRFQSYQANPLYREHRVEESLGMVYKCHYPHYNIASARGIKQTPIHERLERRGAYFTEVSGWESPAWFADQGICSGDDDAATSPYVEKLSWGRENWFPNWAAEHRACREGVVLIDMSFMSKFLVQGKDAGSFLNYLSTSDVDGQEGNITYTQWLNEDGRMEADLTVTKLHSTPDGRQEFLVVATDTMHRHVETWMRRNVPDESDVHITDQTSHYAQINVQGPRSRDLMQQLTSCDMSDESFPFRAVQSIDVGYARCVCARITYVGELGYELFIPSDMARHVYDRLVEAGRTFDLRHAGLKALGSLRLEKGYRDYGHDMDNMDTPLEVGLGFSCDLNKGDFLGREHVVAQKALGLPNLPQRLLQVLVKENPHVMMHHAEIVYRNGVPCGDVRVATYGHTLGGSVGLAMIKRDHDVPFNKAFLKSGTWEVDVAGTRYPVDVSLRPMYDPSNRRVKC